MKINIFGHKGQHATDLIRRGVFEGIQIDDLNEGGSEDDRTPCAFIVPISQTKQLIESISGAHGVNMCGIMSTSKDSKYDIDNFHFLFGPHAQDDMKVAVSGNIGKLSQKIIDNTSQQGIKIIETSIEEHDRKMAIIQATSHTMIFCSAMHTSGDQRLIDEWMTPAGTIADMISFNPQATDMFQDLLSQPAGTNISEFFLDLVSTHLSQGDVKNFSTPSFNRVFEFCQKEKILFTESAKNILTQSIDDPDILMNKISKLQNNVKTPK